MGQREEMLVHGRPSRCVNNASVIHGHKHNTLQSSILNDGTFRITMDKDVLENNSTNKTKNINSEDNLEDPRQGDSCSLVS